MTEDQEDSAVQNANARPSTRPRTISPRLSDVHRPVSTSASFQSACGPHLPNTSHSLSTVGVSLSATFNIASNILHLSGLILADRASQGHTASTFASNPRTRTSCSIRALRSGSEKPKNRLQRFAMVRESSLNDYVKLDRDIMDLQQEVQNIFRHI